MANTSIGVTSTTMGGGISAKDVKTINGESILGSGNIEVAASGGGSLELPYPKIGEETLTTKRHPVSGKPVYTQAYSMTTTGQDFTYDTGLDGITDNIEAVHFALRGDNNTITGTDSYWVADTDERRVYIGNTGIIKINVPDGLTSNDDNQFHVIIEYTKVTDTSSSPVAGIAMVKESGEVLQVAYATNATTLVTTGTYLPISITPKSSNSTIIVEFYGNVVINNATEEAKYFLEVDTVNQYQLCKLHSVNAIYFTSSVSGMGTYTNTTLVDKEFRIAVEATLSPVDGGRSGLKITEVQN